ncbi:class I SAM-dependent methyltransferase [Thalassospira tepidiphila]|uniref:class I SAM-dependent methyltransferase n=1 Tax=Thalassospira tepidiphila TaxID=393657 RepID=UPI003AA83897
MKNFDYTGKDNLDIMSFAKNYNKYLTKLVEAHAPDGGTFLDFGAGTGFFAERVSNQKRKLLCVEPDDDQADEIRKKGFRAVINCEELIDRAADFSYSLNVLEHIEDDCKAMREIYRVLKPGSFFVVYVPAMPCLYSSMDEKVKHFRRYTRRELTSKLKSEGFDVVSCRYADILGVPATLAYKLVGSKSGDVSLRGLVAYDRYAFPLSKVLDTLTHRIAGKNVLAVARKPI